MNSKRLYKVLGFEYDEVVNITFTLKQLTEDDGTEVLYSLQDQIDEILDLPIGDALNVYLHRNVNSNKGVIKRIQ